MSHPCWSLPHLLTSHVPQHAARPGPRDLLQEDTVHPEPLRQEPLPKTSANAVRSESNAKESLSNPNCESARNLRPSTPTGYEPNELTTGEIATIPTMSSGDIYRIWRTRSTSSSYGRNEGIWTNSGTKLTRSGDGRNFTCREDVPPPVPDALRRIYGKHCGLWSRR